MTTNQTKPEDKTVAVKKPPAKKNEVAAAAEIPKTLRQWIDSDAFSNALARSLPDNRKPLIAVDADNDGRWLEFIVNADARRRSVGRGGLDNRAFPF